MSRNTYPPMKTRSKMMGEFVDANPNYRYTDDGLIQSVHKVWYSPPKSASDLCKMFVEIGYIVRNKPNVKGSPWKWACEYRVMNDIRRFPYRPEDKIRDYQS